MLSESDELKITISGKVNVKGKSHKNVACKSSVIHKNLPTFLTDNHTSSGHGRSVVVL